MTQVGWDTSRTGCLARAPRLTLMLATASLRWEDTLLNDLLMLLLLMLLLLMLLLVATASLRWEDTIAIAALALLACT